MLKFIFNTFTKISKKVNNIETTVNEDEIFQNENKNLWFEGEFIKGRANKEVSIKKRIPAISEDIIEHGYSTGTYSVPESVNIEGTYDGEWLDSKFHGSGTYVGNPVYIINGFKSKHKEYKFIGYFNEGRAHGFGKLFSNNQLIYEGTFDKGSLHGKGKIYHDELIVYEGEFANNLFSGKGTVYSRGQVLFLGNFNENTPEGEGTYYGENKISGIFNDGYVYLKEEIYKINFPEPIGLLSDPTNLRPGKNIYMNLSKILVYKGGLKNKLRHGKGKEYDEIINGGGKIVKYEGGFYKNLYHGLGKNDYFEGEFNKGKKHGFGKLCKYKPGQVTYEGFFINDVKHGEGYQYMVYQDNYFVRYRGRITAVYKTIYEEGKLKEKNLIAGIGWISKYFDEKGYGFLKFFDEEKSYGVSVFFHKNDIMDKEILEDLGGNVIFKVKPGKKGYKAFNIKQVKSDSQVYSMK
ncbi:MULTISPECIES: hypothetical protein [Bacillus]|uniref:hypothetical protein n=1 Tax=Bacillus TaxID=1386 RepID=UPI0007A04FD1|nr:MULTISPECIES: hypothetical protein [Bacillus]KYZ65849.1 hypothetical protein A3782_24275 [Bacillus sp. GZT]